MLTERLLGAVGRLSVGRGGSDSRSRRFPSLGRGDSAAELLAQESGLSAAYYILTLAICVLAIAVLPVLQYQVSHAAWRAGQSIFTAVGASISGS